MRYRTDPIFRDAQKKRVSENTRRKQDEKRALRKIYKQEKRIWRKLRINGIVHQCAKISYVAMLIDRTPATIKLWEKSNSFPKPVIYNKMRYYTKAQVILIQRVWTKIVRTNRDLPVFFETLRKEWAILKIKQKKEEDNARR
jgi:hypothetical protein